MKKLIKGIELIVKKDCCLEDIKSFREVNFEEGEVLYFEEYDGRFSSDKVCVMMDRDCNRYLCDVNDIDELFEVV